MAMLNCEQQQQQQREYHINIVPYIVSEEDREKKNEKKIKSTNFELNASLNRITHLAIDAIKYVLQSERSRREKKT